MTLDAFGAEINRLVLRPPETGGAPARDLPVPPIPAGDHAGPLPTVPFPVIPFPPRNQTLGFVLGLETEYRDTLRRQRNHAGFVDVEGSAVWFPEWLRYVLNQCAVTEATRRVLMQIRGQGIQPVCGRRSSGSH